eukprot:PLAT13629.1.p1 GENE.PLAT13629.1~~PLAT13629.1.p1  ORF type:complete len:330 (-),score=122.24 PLAT13629.1:114-1103(-)
MLRSAAGHARRAVSFGTSRLGCRWPSMRAFSAEAASASKSSAKGGAGSIFEEFGDVAGKILKGDGGKKNLLALGGAGLALLTASSCINVVPAGHVGVYDLFGIVSDETLAPGLHFTNPLARVHNMSVKTRRLETDAVVVTNEGLTVTLGFAILFRLQPEYAVTMYKSVGREYERVVLVPAVRSAVRNMASGYEAKALYTTERLQLGEQLCNSLNSSVHDRGLLIEDTPLKKLELPRSLLDAVEAKLAMEQESQRMEFVLKKEKLEAERKVLEAKGIAEFQRIVAEGVNESLLRWKGIEATQELAKSPNAKVIVVGSGKDGLPIILGGHK